MLESSSLGNYFPTISIYAIHQRHRQTDGQTTFSWQSRTDVVQLLLRRPA